MHNSPEDQWNARYKDVEYAYGTEPNVFFKEQIDKIPPGKALFVAEGEGRNAVYAATRGWDVNAFDVSIEGKKKAEKLAEQNKVTINYQVGALPDLGYKSCSFDVIVLVYSHLSPVIRSQYHQILQKLLKPSGMLIVEGFEKGHLAYRQKNPAVGGPPQLDYLFSLEEFQRDFTNMEWEIAEETETELNEGVYHRGTGWVLRMVGRKIS